MPDRIHSPRHRPRLIAAACSLLLGLTACDAQDPMEDLGVIEKASDAPVSAFAPFAPFPYKLSDRFLSLDQAAPRLRVQPFIVFPPLPVDTTAANDFIAQVRANSPPHRLGAKAVRLVQVYSDAPVYLIDGFAVLPDAHDVAVDPATVDLATLCTDPRRCVPISRDHLENAETAAVVLAARTIVVENAHTDGLSLATMSESLLVPEGGDLPGRGALGPRLRPGDPLPADAPLGAPHRHREGHHLQPDQPGSALAEAARGRGVQRRRAPGPRG